MIFFVICYTFLALGSAFLISGLILFLFAKKTTQNAPDGHPPHERITLVIKGFSVSMPDKSHYVMSIIGLVLLFMAQSFFQNSYNDEFQGDQAFIPFISTADASPLESIEKGWVYFGYEKNPTLWNFSFKKGSFNSMIQGNETILKSSKTLNVRDQAFGNFTGTVLGVIDPEPKILGPLVKGDCITVRNYKSVGFSKIWLKYELIPCP